MRSHRCLTSRLFHVHNKHLLCHVPRTVLTLATYTEDNLVDWVTKILSQEKKARGSVDENTRAIIQGQTHQKDQGTGRDVERIVERCTRPEKTTRRRQVEGTLGLHGLMRC